MSLVFIVFIFHLFMLTNVILLLFKFKPENINMYRNINCVRFYCCYLDREKKTTHLCVSLRFFSCIYSFCPPAKIQASRKQQKTSIYDRWDIYKDTGWRVERENIVVKDISSIDGMVPKGWMLHSVVLPYNQQKAKKKNYNQSSSSFCPQCPFFLHLFLYQTDSFSTYSMYRIFYSSKHKWELYASFFAFIVLFPLFLSHNPLFLLHVLFFQSLFE